MNERVSVNYEAALIESGQFSYEPQSYQDLTDGLADTEVVRLKGGAFGLDLPSLPHDSYAVRILAAHPRRVTDADIGRTYLHYNVWWADFAASHRHHFDHDPFTREQSETFMLAPDSQTDAQTLMVHNFGTALDGATKTSLAEAYDYFQDLTNDRFAGFMGAVVLGEHLGLARSGFATEPPPIAGQCWSDGLQPGSVVSLRNSIVSQTPEDTTVGMRRRYAPLFDRGATVADIIATHEFAHALAANVPVLQDHYAATLDWRSRDYSVGHFRRKQYGRLVGQGDALPPPTDYGSLDAHEDFAESMVFQRFAPDLLDPLRQDFFTAMSQALRIAYADRSAQTGETQDGRTELIELDRPVYPHHQLPRRIVASVTKRPPITETVIRSYAKSLDKHLALANIAMKLTGTHRV